MSIYKRRGRWSVAIELPEGIGAQRRRRYVGSFATKTEAKRAERQAELERDHGVGIEPQMLNVSKLLNEYILYRERRRTYATIKRYRELSVKHIERYIGTIRIRDLSSLAIDQMYDKLAETLAPQTILHVHRLAKGAFRWAVKKNLLLRSPFESVDTPEVPRREARWLLPEEAQAVLEAAHGSRFYAPFRFALLTGVRRGELAALSWDDIDLGGGKVTIRHAYSDATGKMVLKGTKSGKPRDIPLSPTASELLRKQWLALTRERWAKPELYRDQNLVFPDALGGPTKLDALSKAFKRMAQVAGVHNAGLHSTRHSAGTYMLAEGIDVPSVQSILGHSVPSTTLNIYGHAVTDLQVGAVATIDAVLSHGFTQRRSA